MRRGPSFGDEVVSRLAYAVRWSVCASFKTRSNSRPVQECRVGGYMQMPAVYIIGLRWTKPWPRAGGYANVRTGPHRFRLKRQNRGNIVGSFLKHWALPWVF
jgi:hypothetical protein